MDVMNNLLSETNQAGLTQDQRECFPSQTLLQIAERFGNILSRTLSGSDEVMLERENISKSNKPCVFVMQYDSTTHAVLARL